MSGTPSNLISPRISGKSENRIFVLVIWKHSRHHNCVNIVQRDFNNSIIFRCISRRSQNYINFGFTLKFIATSWWLWTKNSNDIPISRCPKFMLFLGMNTIRGLSVYQDWPCRLRITVLISFNCKKQFNITVSGINEL